MKSRLDLGKLTSLVARRDPEDWARLLAEAAGDGSPEAARKRVLHALAPGARTDPPAPARESRPEDLYSTARDHFAKAEKRLAEEARVTDRLLDGLRADTTSSAGRRADAVAQQQVVVQAPIDQVASGRFDVTNGLGRTARLSFRPSETRRLGTDDAAWVPIAFDPPRPTLDPDARVRVTMRVDGRALHGQPGETLELDVDVLADDEPVLKVWMEIRLLEAVDSP